MLLKLTSTTCKFVSVSSAGKIKWRHIHNNICWCRHSDKTSSIAKVFSQLDTYANVFHSSWHKRHVKCHSYRQKRSRVTTCNRCYRIELALKNEEKENRRVRAPSVYLSAFANSAEKLSNISIYFRTSVGCVTSSLNTLQLSNCVTWLSI